MVQFCLNKDAFKHFCPQKNSELDDFMSQYVYASFYLFKITDLKAKKTKELMPEELINSFCEFLFKEKNTYGKWIIKNEKAWFKLYIFPFILEKKQKYKQENFFTDVYNRYFAIGHFPQEQNKEYHKYFFVFSDVNHTEIKKFFTQKTNDIENLKKIEIEELHSRYINQLLLSGDSAKQFTLNQFKVEFPFMYLGDHITIKDNLNNIRWLNIPYNEILCSH